MGAGDLTPKIEGNMSTVHTLNQLKKTGQFRAGHRLRNFVFRSAAAFTLIEMLVVIVVIGLLLATAAPSLLGSMNASRVTQAGETIAGFLSNAQSRANGNSRPVEIRFYRVPSDEDAMVGQQPTPRPTKQILHQHKGAGLQRGPRF